MVTDLKPYRYSPRENAVLDSEFAAAARYENVRLGTAHLFWKPLFRWHVIPLSRVERLFRRVEDVYGKMCCGGRSFRMEKLALILKNGEELEIHIGDDVEPKAKALLEALKAGHPEILYGKP